MADTDLFSAIADQQPLLSKFGIVGLGIEGMETPSECPIARGTSISCVEISFSQSRDGTAEGYNTLPSLTFEAYEAQAMANFSYFLDFARARTMDADATLAAMVTCFCDAAGGRGTYPERAVYGSDLKPDDLGLDASLSPIHSLPRSRSSLFSRLSHSANIEGVTTPLAYTGSPFAPFNPHVEDLQAKSVSHLLYGAIKVWWGISNIQAAEFAEYLIGRVNSARTNQPINLMTLMVDPRELVAEGFDVTIRAQSEGSFVVTDSAAFHMGFNTGINIALASNYISDDGLPYARLKAQRDRSLPREQLFDYRRLVLSSDGPMGPFEAVELERIIDEERKIIEEQSVAR